MVEIKCQVCNIGKVVIELDLKDDGVHIFVKKCSSCGYKFKTEDFEGMFQITMTQPDSCIYEPDKSTAMNCKHCGEPKHRHKFRR